MKTKMHQYKCRICGTTTLSMKKAPMCEACGSDDLVCIRQRKTYCVLMRIAKILIGSAIVGGIIAFILI